MPAPLSALDDSTLESTFDIEVLPIDGEVAAEWARLRVQLALTGRRMNVNDLWIAAPAATHDLPWSPRTMTSHRCTVCTACTSSGSDGRPTVTGVTDGRADPALLG